MSFIEPDVQSDQLSILRELATEPLTLNRPAFSDLDPELSETRIGFEEAGGRSNPVFFTASDLNAQEQALFQSNQNTTSVENDWESFLNGDCMNIMFSDS